MNLLGAQALRVFMYNPKENGAVDHECRNNQIVPIGQKDRGANDNLDHRADHVCKHTANQAIEFVVDLI